MEEHITRPEDVQNCSLCKTPLTINQNFCVNCGYPQRGSEQEQSSFHAQRILKNRRGQEASKKIKSGRNSLYIISGLSLLFGMVYYFMHDDTATLIASTILAIIYLVLGYWSQKRPLIALVLGLLVYLTIIVINALVDPDTIGKGIIIKILIIFYLAKGINSALQLRKAE